MAFDILAEDARRIRKLLSMSRGMVLATVHADGTPEAARVNFTTGPEYTLFFCTSSNYRKAANLKRHKRVAAVVTTDKLAVQIEGDATPVSRPTARKVLNKLERKYGTYDPYVKNHALCYRVTPAWMRYIDKLGREPVFYTYTNA